TYGSLDPDRVKRGAVNIGIIEGMTSPKGAALSFTMGEGATLPVDKGDEGDCKVWMRRLGPYLLVNDNNNCGGMNVSFSGVYTRKIEPPKGTTKPDIPEKWSATSHTAMAITGDVRFSPSKITFENGKALPLTLFEKASLFKDDIEGGVMAHIYKVVTPSDPKLLNGNRLCGGAKPVPVTFIAVWKPKSGGVWMAPSSRTTKPKGMDDICGTYRYEPG
ncbi:MAG: hypothetical protein ACRECU_02990, partial [Methylocella sp.]